MPVKSKAQFRLMQAAKHGKAKDGPSPAQADEMLDKTKTPYKKLPATKAAKKASRKGKPKGKTGKRGR